MPKPIQIQGKDYYVSLGVARGSTADGNVNLVVELYDAAEGEGGARA